MKGWDAAMLLLPVLYIAEIICCSKFGGEKGSCGDGSECLRWLAGQAVAAHP